MEKFSFVIHPLTLQDYTRKFPAAGYLPDFVLQGMARVLPPFKVSEIKGISSAWAQAEGEFVCCPLTSRQLLQLPAEVTLDKIRGAVKLAARNGAKLVGLGALPSFVSEGGRLIAKEVGIPITTGSSYTVFIALEGIKEAAKLMEIDWAGANVLILGAAGSIGSVCACFLARENRSLTLVARQRNKLEKLAAKILYETGLAAKITANMQEALGEADIVIAATSALDIPVEPEALKPGAVVCDVARSRDVSLKVAGKREDVLVIEGGVVAVPGKPEFNFNFGIPPGKCYACMAEVMILALEKRYESFSLGKEMTLRQVKEIGGLAQKHGFKLAGLRSFGKNLTWREIENIKKKNYC
ncbi:MAG: saccharopine dehydrogenase NADP-binding domain-containing protein [Clostridia bacterium]|nr:saccharopine dehydrogenase NADP-binding domain-containing protein [Clostridia bacterium]MDD4146603.1 saccharopine dehydrogenase NADP-binding domain-containing protein [Clostridia bacterium]MDD4666107.1 saccharopine dehydrogenase NADP-binding domain-containing protein [Clostridia bacterium]